MGPKDQPLDSVRTDMTETIDDNKGDETVNNKLKLWGLYRTKAREEIRDKLMDFRPGDPMEDDKRGVYSLEEINEATREILGLDLKAMPDEHINHILRHHGITVQEAQKIAARAIKFRIWCRERFAANKESLFIKHKNSLTHVIYTIVRTRSQELCEELYCRLVAKESNLEELAKLFSEGDEAARGGRIGPVAIEEMGPVVRRLLEVSQVGQTWPPKQIEDWWVILRLDERNEASMNEEVMMEVYRREAEEMIDLIFLQQEAPPTVKTVESEKSDHVET